jgi:hypothetical protein
MKSITSKRSYLLLSNFNTSNLMKLYTTFLYGFSTENMIWFIKQTARRKQCVQPKTATIFHFVFHLSFTITIHSTLAVLTLNYSYLIDGGMAIKSCHHFTTQSNFTKQFILPLHHTSQTWTNSIIHHIAIYTESQSNNNNNT